MALNLGMDRRFVLETPLMWIDKAETWRLAERLGGGRWWTSSWRTPIPAIFGERGPRHPWGHGCGTCPACQLRAEGFARYEAARVSE